MVDLAGLISVAEAARRLNRSPEQVRRDLRRGKLKGQRIGTQWFVESASVVNGRRPDEPLIPREVAQDVRRIAQGIAEKNPGYVFDPVEMVRRVREGD